jgi:hypothetical protein
MTASDNLLPSLDLVQRVLSADAAYTIFRMQVLERLPGNPIGIAYRWVDETVVALAARFLPSFTRVIGLRSGHERHVEPLVRWYREQGLVPTFEMARACLMQVWAASWRDTAFSSPATMLA